MDVKKNFDKKTLVALGAGLGAAIVATLLFIMIDSFKEPEPKAEKNSRGQGTQSDQGYSERG